MRRLFQNALFAGVVLLAMSACKSSHQTPASPVELKHFSLDSLESVRATTALTAAP